MSQQVKIWLSFCHKRVANDFQRQFEYLWKSSKKYKNFYFPRKKEVVNIDKDCDKSAVDISQKTKFINSAGSMAIWLSNHVDNLTEKK